VQKGKYFSNKPLLSYYSTEIKSPDKVLELSREIYKDENSRRSSVNEKCKVLLTISSILLAVIALLLKSMFFHLLVLLPVLFIFLTVFMILIYFDVGSYSCPDFNEEMIKSVPEKFSAELSKDYISCVEHNRLTQDFLIDVYRVAKNSLLIGLILMICVFVIYVNFPAYFMPAVNASNSATMNGENSQSLLEETPVSGPNEMGDWTVNHESIQGAMSEIYNSSLIAWITVIVGIILFLFGLISSIYLYIRPKTNIRYFIIVFWAVAPPVWFMLEYNVLYRCYGIHTSEVFEHFKYNQQLAAAVWVGIGAVLGAELLMVKHVQNKDIDQKQKEIT
jgi:hypothetical protein